MPAWGKSIGDEEIWGMVAFLQQLPVMTAAAYDEQVASSDGHAHGPPEEPASPHVHDDGSPHEHKNPSN
jgi:mono/diheme cytochrome c family protein